ncbi:PD40 domain-containing protein [Polyangium sorediatum]|uniref:PD40 domain-containing protein n=1 Tax=Polyangium sorediatum TaxID=889274 RepID=A0ABT6P8W5_9BACT|nr:PD40 domain-containing protein [Polyangium sorediatum]MDI1437053.1 PD40 domain-containing protein [Polyangium sorediatum]
MTRDRLWFLFLAAAVSSAGAIAACGGGGESSGGAAGSGASGPDAGSSGGGGSGGEGGEGGFINFDGGEQSLVIEPLDPILDVTGVPGSLPFHAKLTDGSNPGAVDWFLDDVTVGTIGADGVFASGGFVAGKAKVTAKSGQLEASTTLTVRVKIAENAGSLTPDDQTKLDTGGNADPGFRWLYPYDKTVFPRGLSAPTLQLAGNADAVLVQIHVGDFEYKGYFGGSAPARVELPPAVWKGVTQSAGPGAAVSVTATKLVGGVATGPVTQSWRIAQGSLSGIVYYNTYVSKLANGGAVMRIKPGSNAEVLLGGCNVCHSVSANGNVLATGVNWTVDNPLDSASYDLTQDGTASQRYLDNDGRKFSFGGLTPDGTYMITNGIPASGSPVRGLAGEYPSVLLDTKTGANVGASSFTNAVKYALTPTFSPDGKHLAFSWYDASPGRTLAMMDVDLLQSPPSFSAITELLTVPSGIVGWPSFTPDGAAVLYHAGDRFDTAGYGATASYGEVFLVETATKAVNKLAALNGYDENGQLYLPFGDAEEARLNYEPTILPVAVGGYYWVFFTSRRVYGNTIGPGGTVPEGNNKWGKFENNVETPSPRKKLWVAAIDIDYQGKPDPSHPAFYLPGQELEAGNMRAFAALEPCKDLNQPCESAASCCNGNVCRPADVNGDGTKELVCVPPPANECAQEGESCETAANCCAPGSLCINNRCAAPTPK